MQKGDELKIEKGLCELDKIINTVHEAKSMLLADWNTYLFSENIPKPYARVEQASFNQGANEEAQ